MSLPGGAFLDHPIVSKLCSLTYSFPSGSPSHMATRLASLICKQLFARGLLHPRLSQALGHAGNYTEPVCMDLRSLAWFGPSRWHERLMKTWPSLYLQGKPRVDSEGSWGSLSGE